MTATATERGVRARIDRLLHDGWSVRAVRGPCPDNLAGRSVPATVPGSIHTDLLAAGLIVDPYLDANERLLAWIGSCDWRYSTAFDWSDDGHEHSYLVFEGLDTVAHIELNGEPVADTLNMHRTYRFDVRALLREGRNDLAVVFSSPLKYADGASVEQGYRPHVNHHPYNAIRKMACSFGWDWGLDTATVGIWRPVVLSSWSSARLESVRPTASVDGARGTVLVRADLERTSQSPARVRVSCGGASATVDLDPGQTVAELELVIEGVERWWPRGHGGQPLYDIAVELAQDGATRDQWAGRVGFRTLHLDHEADENGTSFTFVINDRPIFVKGANWIPDDAFPHRVDRERYAKRLQQAESAGINLLRVWGGGIYESDDFYDLCDERGILTWQDFLFACAAYTEDEPMRSEVEAEARDNIVRLMPHPSLVLWNGNNENLWGYEEWGWANRLRGRSWGLGYYLRLFPALVAELDPYRPYTPGSPFSPAGRDQALERHPNDPSHGSTHLWELWNRQDYPHYRDTVARFVGEFGWQGPPTWSTMTRAISDRPLTPESPGMLVHQKAADGNVKLIDGLIAHLPLPDGMDDWHWAMSLNQAIAVQVGIEHFRSMSPVCMGTIVWQLNDCWPATSWAAIDGDGRAKPLLYSITHAYADRLLTVQPRDGGLIVAAVNDTADSWRGVLVIRRLDFSGRQIDIASYQTEIPARESLVTAIPESLATAGDARNEVLVVTLEGTRALWFYSEYRDSALEPARLRVDVEPAAGGYLVAVTAENLVRDIAMLIDKLDPMGEVDDQLVTLLPGEEVTFMVRSAAELAAGDFALPAVLRNANQLVAATE